MQLANIEFAGGENSSSCRSTGHPCYEAAGRPSPLQFLLASCLCLPSKAARSRTLMRWLVPTSSCTSLSGVLDKQGLEVPLDTEGPVVLLDLSLGVLPLLREAAEDLGRKERRARHLKRCCNRFRCCLFKRATSQAATTCQPLKKSMLLLCPKPTNGISTKVI